MLPKNVNVYHTDDSAFLQDPILKKEKIVLL